MGAAAEMRCRQAAPLAEDYPPFEAKCKGGSVACIKAGTLDFVLVYGEIEYEDLDFFTMLDQTLPPSYNHRFESCLLPISAWANAAMLSLQIVET